MIQYIFIFLLANCATTIMRATNKDPSMPLPDFPDIPSVPDDEEVIVGQKSQCFPLGADLELSDFIQQNLFDLTKSQYSNMLFRYQLVNGYKYEVFIDFTFSDQVTRQKIVILRNAIGFSILSIEDATGSEC